MRKKKNKKMDKRRQQKFVSRFKNQPEVVSFKEIISNVASMFSYHKQDVAEILEYYSNENVERIAKCFIDIIENKRFSFRHGKTVLTCEVEADIFGPVKALVTLKNSDMISEKMVRAMINELFNYNKKGKYDL